MQAVDIDGKFHDVSQDEISWRPSVYGIVIEDDKILLSPQHGKGYDLPGGGVELDERFDDALIREVKEETGIDVRPEKLLDLRDNIFKITFREPQEVFHSVMAYYLCEKIGGEISADGFDEHEVAYAEQAEWVPLDRLDAIKVASSYDWREVVKAHLCAN